MFHMNFKYIWGLWKEAPQSSVFQWIKKQQNVEVDEQQNIS